MSFLNKFNVRVNLISGFTIFLIALPLSIGISVASGAPPTAGLLSAIVGGILASIISGSQVTISGPAAGLIVVVLECINELGQGDAQRGFKLMLAAAVFAGALQIIMGLLKMGTVGLAVPLNALHGMMASIGVTIMIKQFYVLGGIKAQSKTIIGQMAELPFRIVDDNLVILGIGAVCLLLVIIFNKMDHLKKIVPPALVAVITGYFLSLWIDIEHSHFVNIFNHEYSVGPEFLLKIPTQINEFFYTPLFEQLGSATFIKAIITIALVASVESLLSTNAVDKLDPLKRTSNLNMDLISKGASNILLGMIGGLPIISELVRSSANVASGATNRLSNFFHGIFILAFVILFPQLLSHIPLTAFASVLIFVGYRLADPSQVLRIYKKEGLAQLSIFLVTLITTLSTDLLIGVFVGVLLNFVINMIQTSKPLRPFHLDATIKTESDQTIITVAKDCTFVNMLKLKKILDKTTTPKVSLHFLDATFVDLTSLHWLMTMKDQFLNQQRELILNNLDIFNHSDSH